MRYADVLPHPINNIYIYIYVSIYVGWKSTIYWTYSRWPWQSSVLLIASIYILVKTQMYINRYPLWLSRHYIVIMIKAVHIFIASKKAKIKSEHFIAAQFVGDLSIASTDIYIWG